MFLGLNFYRCLLTYGTQTWAMKDENLQSGKSGAYDGEVDVWSVDEGKKAK